MATRKATKPGGKSSAATKKPARKGKVAKKSARKKEPGFRRKGKLYVPTATEEKSSKKQTKLDRALARLEERLQAMVDDLAERFDDLLEIESMEIEARLNAEGGFAVAKAGTALSVKLRLKPRP